MAQFDVRYIDAGRVLQRRVDAADVQAAGACLAVGAASILSVQPATESGTPGLAGSLAPRRRFPLRLFSREVGVLLGAGVPLMEALVTLREKESSTRVHDALSGLIARLEVGEAFSAAVAARPQDFDPLFAAVVGAAERGGQLREALESHSRYLAWVEELRDRLVAAALYPMMLVIASVAVLVFLLIHVVPRFATLMDGMGGDIPAGSRLLLQAGAWTGAHPVATVALALALFALPWAASQHPPWRDALSRASWALPGLGGRLRVLALARLYRTVSMLLASGVPAVPALQAARGVVAPHLRAPLDAAIEQVARGERLSVAFDREGLSTPVSARMVRVGERSGEVGPMLGQAAAFYDEELARLSEVVTRLVNPLLMLLMGGLIGTVIVLLYMPIFQLAEQVQ